MIRNVGATLLGLVVQVIVVATLEATSHALWPPPPGIDPTNPEFIAAIMDQIPLPAKVAVLVGWALGALVGGAVAARVGTGRGLRRALVVGGFQLLGVGASLAMIPHPLWMAALGLATPLPMAWLGARVVGRG